MNVVLNVQSSFYRGIFIGLLIAIFLYNVLIYFSIREKYILYYCLILFISFVNITNIIPNILGLINLEKKYIFILEEIIHPIAVLNCFIFFTKYFFGTSDDKLYNYLIIIFNILLFMSFSTYIIYSFDYMPVLPLLIIPLLSFLGTNFLKEHQNLVYSYILGSFVLFFPHTYAGIISYFDLNINYDYRNMILICTVLSSMLISFSISIRLKNISTEKSIYEKQFFTKAKYTAMGEMIANIAHQWKQPLSNLSTILINIQMHDEHKSLSTKVLNSKVSDANTQISYMSNTINDFLNFFSQKKTLEEFSLFESVQSSLLLVSASFYSNQIKTNMITIDESTVNTCKNELIQVLTTLLTNAKDALKNKDDNRNIYINISQKVITIEDNAGGIAEDIIEKIFDPYFSTKEEKNGTGLGLYTAKIIIEKNIGGSLHVENTEQGAKFTIDLTNIS